MKKIKIDAYLIVMAVVTAGIGAYALLTGNWATPITDWLLMGQVGFV